MLNYHGLDGVIRRSALSFDPPPAEAFRAARRFIDCVLAPGEITRVFLSIGCDTMEGGKTSHSPAR